MGVDKKNASAATEPPLVAAPTLATRDGATRATDMDLIESCLAGDDAAWAELFNRRQPGLMRATRALVRARPGDGELAEEVAARVWFTLVRDDCKVLRRFDPGRDHDFAGFLRGVARFEALRHRRAERRRQVREADYRAVRCREISGLDVAVLLNEFIGQLSPADLAFLKDVLLSMPDASPVIQQEKLSQTAFWQRRHRLRAKLRDFCGGNGNTKDAMVH